MRRILFALAFVACSSQPAANTTTAAPAVTKTDAPAPTAEKTADTNMFGKSFEKKDVVEFGAAVKDPAPFLNKTIQLQGKVSAVCQNKGCWMEMTDAETNKKIRIIAENHSFGVPKDCSGKTAIAEGVLSSTEVSQEEAAHLASEAGQPAPTGPVQELRLTATGVILL